MKVLSIPSITQLGKGESGVHTVVRQYFRYAKKYGIDFVDPKSESYDLVAAHAGITRNACDVAHLHGLYFTGDYPATMWQHKSNKKIVEAIRGAKIVTVPSSWVQEIFQRDMRFSPAVLPHGVDWEAWQHEEPTMSYVLGYAKNRAGQDVCDPSYLSPLARRFPKMKFLSTYHPDGAPQNVEVIKRDKMKDQVPYDDMKLITQRSAVFVQAVKETFGLHMLEAMAAGVPVVAYNHGGATQLVKHGVNGYLAEPGNIEDLAQGLAYCLKYRHKLGENSKELAKLWTWEKAVERLSDIYRQALEPNIGGVGVVIPVYNKESTLERAVNSVLSQTRLPEMIVILDDCSTDKSGEIGIQLAERYVDIVKYIRQPNNGGVSKARNRGIAECDGLEYVCCLDGDDQIAPEFIGTCLEAFERDPELHLAYTRLQQVYPDGHTELSQWPGEWDFEKQVAKPNQVPTCNVFRKETFDRLGGFRSRYEQRGCGSEDAALWTQFGLHGYKCALVSEEPLFLYSVGAGGTAYQGYTEPDWRALYAPIHDGIYPFASYKNPINGIAHPVFQYDEPVISVVVPVGPGHLDNVSGAFDSVESQRGFRKWEIIAVNDSGERIPEKLTKAYPYVRWLETTGKLGPGYARNRGVEYSRGKFIVFLDADDMLMPDFMVATMQAWSATQSIIYTNYLGSAIISEEEARIQDEIGKLRSYGKDKPSVIAYPSVEPRADFDCELAQSMPRFPLYHWCLVTCLIPKVWHMEIGGFDEKMRSWEDVDYHWRMAWAGHCYVRVRQELVMYRFISGSRRMAASADTEEGAQLGRKLLRYIESKKENIEMAPCSGCGNRRAPRVARQSPAPTATRVVRANVTQTSDEDFALYLYTSPNRGDHLVIGGHLFVRRIEGVNMIKSSGGFRINYGRHSGGDPQPFLVHRLDAESQPGYFKKYKEYTEAPKEQPQEPEAPEPVELEDNQDPLANLAKLQEAAGVISEALGSEVNATFEDPGEIHYFDDVEDAIEWLEEEDEFDPQTLPGVTAGIAAQLSGKTLDDIKKMTKAEWVTIKGVADVRAENIMAYLQTLE